MLPIKITCEDKILIVSPHPDDECIGAGGMIAAYPNQCAVLLLTDGAYGQSDVATYYTIELREKEFESEMKHAAINNYKMLHLEDGTLFQNLKVLSELDFSAYTKIFVTSAKDRHPDHRAAFCAVKNMLYEQRLENVELYQIEVNAPLSWPTHYFDISDYIDQKKQLISFHQSQIKDRDYMKMAEMMALFRGYQANLDGRYLECYYFTDMGAQDGSPDYEKETQLQKYTSFYRTQNIWLYCRNMQYSITDYLYDMGYKRIAIYGYGDLGKRLCEELEETKIEQIVVVDKRADKWNNSAIKIVTPDNVPEEVDMMIITVFATVIEIQKSVKIQCVMKQFNELLNEMIVFYEK